MTTLQVLLADGVRPGTTEDVGPDDAEARLRALWAPPAGTTRWVRANMITTLDGAATGADGRTGSINGPADLRVFTTLRSLADVVLVGAGTVRSEGYRAPRLAPALAAARRAAGQPEAPALAVVTARGDLPDAVLADDPAPWVLTRSDAPHLTRLRDALPADRLLLLDPEGEHERRGRDGEGERSRDERGGGDPGAGVGVDLAAGLRALADAGLGHVLTEGGPALLAALVAAGLLDELCLTTSPALVAGDGPRVLAGPWLDPPVRLAPTQLLLGDGMLLGRWRVERA